VVAAIQEQASKLLHGQINILYHQPVFDLVDALLPEMPSGLDTFFFANSGAEAVEAAMKLARAPRAGTASFASRAASTDERRRACRHELEVALQAACRTAERKRIRDGLSLLPQMPRSGPRRGLLSKRAERPSRAAGHSCGP